MELEAYFSPWKIEEKTLIAVSKIIDPNIHSVDTNYVNQNLKLIQMIL
ncbi:hypothetical protein BH10PSE19_BH10PSE19_01230 [soil metagenome]